MFVTDAAEIRHMTMPTKRFICEAIAMVHNSFPREEVKISVKPTTDKAFWLTIVHNDKCQEYPFSAAEIKGVKGTQKLAKMIARL